MPNPIDDNELEPVRDDPVRDDPQRDDPQRDDLVRWDPVYLHARREAVEILLAWAISLGWSVGYCSLHGYSDDAPLAMVLGIPSWVFWGVGVPWVVASVFTCYYSLVHMKNDSLDREPPASDADASARGARQRREA